MKECQAERVSSNISEFIKWTKCDQKTYFNFDHNCLIMLNQKHFILFMNDFCKWDKAIEMDKATLNLPSLNLKDSSIESRKSQIFIINNNTILFNDDFSSLYSFPSFSYSFPTLFYSFVIYKKRILHFSIYFNNSWELIIASIDIHSYFQLFIFLFAINIFKNTNCSDFDLIKQSFHSILSFTFHYKIIHWSNNQ